MSDEETPKPCPRDHHPEGNNTVAIVALICGTLIAVSTIWALLSLSKLVPKEQIISLLMPLGLFGGALIAAVYVVYRLYQLMRRGQQAAQQRTAAVSTTLQQVNKKLNGGLSHERKEVVKETIEQLRAEGKLKDEGPGGTDRT